LVPPLRTTCVCPFKCVAPPINTHTISWWLLCPPPYPAAECLLPQLPWPRDRGVCEELPDGHGREPGARDPAVWQGACVGDLWAPPQAPVRACFQVAAGERPLTHMLIPSPPPPHP